MTEVFVIRPVRESDADAISALAKRTYAEAFESSFLAEDLACHLETHLSADQFRKSMGRDVLLAAEQGDALMGYVQFGAASGDNAFCNDRELKRLYVASNWQGRGVGTALLQAALQHPLMRDAACILLDVWEHNHGAQRFYRRHGFEVVGTQSFEVASGSETSLDLIMVRRQSSGSTDAPRSDEK